jgi:hypothetical protein
MGILGETFQVFCLLIPTGRSNSEEPAKARMERKIRRSQAEGFPKRKELS